MRLVTPEVERGLKVSRSCYEAGHEPMTGLVTWQRIALPRAGGAGEQDERTMHALDIIADEPHRLAVERFHRDLVQRRKRQRELKDKRRGR